MRMLNTSMVATVEIEGSIVAACWDGGPTIAVFVHVDGLPRRAAEWSVWIEEWDSPLIEPTRSGFERFVLARLAEPGAVGELLTAAA